MSETCRAHLWDKIIIKLFASSWYIFLTCKWVVLRVDKEMNLSTWILISAMGDWNQGGILWRLDGWFWEGGFGFLVGRVARISDSKYLLQSRTEHASASFQISRSVLVETIAVYSVYSVYSEKCRNHRKWIVLFYIWVSVHHKSIIYNKPTRCNCGSIVFINNYKYALHVSDALCVHLQEHYKL